MDRALKLLVAAACVVIIAAGAWFASQVYQAYSERAHAEARYAEHLAEQRRSSEEAACLEIVMQSLEQRGTRGEVMTGDKLGPDDTLNKQAAGCLKAFPTIEPTLRDRFGTALEMVQRGKKLDQLLTLAAR